MYRAGNEISCCAKYTIIERAVIIIQYADTILLCCIYKKKIGLHQKSRQCNLYLAATMLPDGRKERTAQAEAAEPWAVV